MVGEEKPYSNNLRHHYGISNYIELCSLEQ